MTSEPDRESQKAAYSRSYSSSRREALLILLAWAILLLWTVGYSSNAGQVEENQELVTVLGLPEWVFWGVLIPWIAALVFSIGFALFLMEDDDHDTEMGQVSGGADREQPWRS